MAITLAHQAWQRELAAQFRGLDPRDPGQWPLAPRVAAWVGALALSLILGWVLLLADAVEAGPGIGQAEAEPLMHVAREMLKKLLLRLCQPRRDLLVEFGLELGKSGVDLRGCAAPLVDRQDPFLKIDP